MCRETRLGPQLQTSERQVLLLADPSQSLSALSNGEPPCEAADGLHGLVDPRAATRSSGGTVGEVTEVSSVSHAWNGEWDGPLGKVGQCLLQLRQKFRRDTLVMKLAVGADGSQLLWVGDADGGGGVDPFGGQGGAVMVGQRSKKVLDFLQLFWDFLQRYIGAW